MQTYIKNCGGKKVLTRLWKIGALPAVERSFADHFVPARAKQAGEKWLAPEKTEGLLNHLNGMDVQTPCPKPASQTVVFLEIIQPARERCKGAKEKLSV